VQIKRRIFERNTKRKKFSKNDKGKPHQVQIKRREKRVCLFTIASAFHGSWSHGAQGFDNAERNEQ